uniref:RNA-binding protein NOB1 n=1 Tax=Steinernema glaseri TaxID=37863 RepID=A0A1I8A394_9BILA
MKSPDEVPVHHLVVDACCLIKNAPLHDVGSVIYTVPQVISELRDKKTRERVAALPYEILLKEPSPQSIAEVSEAAKKTGDYASLSPIDIKVVALTHELHVENCGKETINYEIERKVELVSGHRSLLKELSTMAGFVVPKKKEKAGDESTEDNNNQNEDEEKGGDAEGSEAEEEVEETESESEDDYDEEGWLNEDNIDEALRQLGAITIDEKNVKVACMSTDFAVQNVLLHMKLGLVSMDGMRIQKLKSYILRCRSCFSTTSVMTKRFCPKCGNDALHRVACTMDDNGALQLHINWNRVNTHRGLKYSLPAPGKKTGKHAARPQLFEDQRMPQNRMAKVRMDPLDDSPFALNDVTSRSALLGLRSLQGQGQRSNRNPNAYGPSRKKRGGKKH